MGKFTKRDGRKIPRKSKTVHRTLKKLRRGKEYNTMNIKDRNGR